MINTGIEQNIDNKKYKRILVMMSSYNGEKYVETQIRSIFRQTVTAQITLRIRDDGSDDNTVKIIKKLKKEYPIEIIEGQNIGYNASFFELINNASGYDYYSISDQDDLWLSSKLEEAMRTLEKEEALDRNTPLLYASTSYLVYDDLRPYGQTRRKQRSFTIYNTAIQNICPGHTQVMNNALIRIIQDKNIDTSRIYVYDSWITNYAMLYGKILFNNSSFTFYRQHKGNQLGSGAGKIGQLIESIKRKDSGDGHKYRMQIEYFVEKNKKRLEKVDAYEEFLDFFSAETFIKRIKYIFHCKLYRQSKIETVFFRMGVACGYY